MGITPGGATPASFMSYGVAKRMSKDGDKFGTGQIEGVIAPETAAHAAGTSALLPMLTLGIPGSPTAAVLLGGLLIWGLQPGPLLFVEQKDFVWGAYTVHNSMFDVYLMLVFGVLGYLFKKLDYPLAPLVLALVLGDRAEDSFRQAILGSQGNLGIFFSNGLVGTITALALLLLLWPAISRLTALVRTGKSAA
jgi:putative tricarboxylic transport membrane protein